MSEHDEDVAGFVVSAGVHVYVEVEFTMTHRNTLGDVVRIAGDMGAAEVRDALTARCLVQDAPLQEHRTGCVRLDSIQIVRKEEGQS